jgi:hypothetical protein
MRATKKAPRALSAWRGACVVAAPEDPLVTDDRALVKRHIDALIADAALGGTPPDVVGRLVLQEVTALWLKSRSWSDIAAELEFHAKSLDPDSDFEFMRP